MNEKEKAYAAFEKVIRKEIAKAEERLEKKIVRNMNATGNDGTVYTSEHGGIRLCPDFRRRAYPAFAGFGVQE